MIHQKYAYTRPKASGAGTPSIIPCRFLFFPQAMFLPITEEKDKHCQQKLLREKVNSQMWPWVPKKHQHKRKTRAHTFSAKIPAVISPVNWEPKVTSVKVGVFLGG